MGAMSGKLVAARVLTDGFSQDDDDLSVLIMAGTAIE